MIMGLLKMDYYLVFVDEFLVNRETINTYGWAQKSKPGRLIVRPSSFKMSLVAGHGVDGVEGIMGDKKPSSIVHKQYSPFIELPSVYGQIELLYYYVKEETETFLVQGV